MIFQTFIPPTTLRAYVRFFWVLEGELEKGKSYVHRTLADGCPELLFHYKGRFDKIGTDGKTDKSFISGIHGQSQQFGRFIIDQSFGIFGVYLYPFTVPELFGIPATEVSGQMPDLYSFLGREGNVLEERIMLANDNAERIEIVAHFLEQRLRKISHAVPGAFRAIYDIIQTRGLVSVGALSDKYCLSVRQFERKFKASAGFSPKLYTRIIRFSAAVNEYRNKEKLLTEIAHDCGYYDQSHFIHDFKQFSGFHPKVFFSGKAEGTDWMEQG